MSKQRGLGRGLGALLGDPLDGVAQENEIRKVSLQSVEPNPLQPRQSFDEEALDELAESLRQHGMIQPIAVRETEFGTFQIIAGERRWRAARRAGLTEVPIVVIQADDKTAMELAMIENLQRKDLNPMEEAQGYQSLMQEHGMTQDEVSQCVGKSRSAVANSLRLLNLPDGVQNMLAQGKLTGGHARAVLMLKSAKQQQDVAQKIVNLDLSVRQAENLCRNLSKEPIENLSVEPQPIRVDYMKECEKQLTKLLGRHVKIINGKRKGKFELEFYGQDDLQRLIDASQTMKISGDK